MWEFRNPQNNFSRTQRSEKLRKLDQQFNFILSFYIAAFVNSIIPGYMEIQGFLPVTALLDVK
jgi:hypothetical protein